MTLFDLAKRLRVSTATVSRALNPATAPLVAEPLRSKIQSYARKTHYSPNQAARHLVSGRTHTIGVILYSAFKTLFFSEYLSSIQWGIAAGLEIEPQFGCKVVILPRGKPLTEVDQAVIGTGVDGILISGLRDLRIRDLEEMVRLAERRWPQPMVALNLGQSKRSRISTVSFSNVKAAYGAITHLIQSGRIRIGLVYNADNAPDVQDRIQGFKQALEDHQLAWTPAAITTGDASPESGYRATLDLFKNKENADLSAIFCTNDEMAFGVMRALRSLGKRCPEDVAVMGFDGLLAGEYTTPRLSTAAQPFFEIAKAGTRLLLDLVEGRQKGPVHLMIPSQLILRDSA